MLPTASDYWQHPIVSLRTTLDIWKLTLEHETTVTAVKRKHKVDDVVKRSEYRKAHGLEQKGGFGNWTARDDPDPSKPEKREKFFGVF